MNRILSRITPATWITISRFIFIPFVLVPLIGKGPHGNIQAFVWFIFAMISDSLDGYIARKYNQVSDLGKFLDPLADKLLILPILFVLCAKGMTPLLPSLIILVREVIVVVLRWRALFAGRSFSASLASKIKTDCLTIGIGLLLVNSYLPLSDIFRTIGEISIICGAVIAVYSALGYLPHRQNWGPRHIRA